MKMVRGRGLFSYQSSSRLRLQLIPGRSREGEEEEGERRRLMMRRFDIERDALILKEGL